MNKNASYAVKRRDSSNVARVMRKFPSDIAQSFTAQQRNSIVEVMDAHFNKKHAIDLRGTLPVPFFPTRIYFVLLFGRDARSLSRQEATIALATLLLMIVVFITGCIVLGLLAIYLIKSALGINLFEDISLGVWTLLFGA